MAKKLEILMREAIRQIVEEIVEDVVNSMIYDVVNEKLAENRVAGCVCPVGAVKECTSIKCGRK